MEQNFQKEIKEPLEAIFKPNNSAAKVLIPLLDALNWQGDNSKVLEALGNTTGELDTDGLMETMANLNFRFYKIDKFKGKNLDQRILPVLFVDGNKHFMVLNIDEKYSLIFDGDSGIYRRVDISEINGDLYYFRYAEDVGDSLIHPQNNWFNKLVFRFKMSFTYIALLTLLITVLDLLMPVFVALVFDRIIYVSGVKPLILIFIGVILYLIASFSLNQYRATLLNYISTRMGNIILAQTFSRLVYLSPSYTETASINSQISRIKDFENIKGFVTSDNFISIFNLIFAFIYISAIFFMGGIIGIIPIIALFVLVLVGLVMRPYHKILMEKFSETSSKKQQNLIEILKNANEIKTLGTKDNWIQRSKKFLGENILGSYDISNYVSFTNNISYFISNIAVLFVIYNGTMQVISERITAGTLISIMMLTWKVMGPIRSAFSIAVQINGLTKSISQVNRFMKLPQDNNLKTNMIANKNLQGHIRFIDVYHRYNANSNAALMGVNFTILPGQLFGITGHDGSGKSTVLKLVLGMYQAQAGRIIMDDINIRQLEPLSLRKSIAYAPEKDFILSGTLRDNFRSFNPGISDEKILELSEKTGLDEYLNFFNNLLDTKLDEALINDIPMKVKKLINLTRMLSRDSKIYLIDEPEFYLDAENIEKIIKVFKEIAKSRGASLIIATRNTKILNACTKVIYLDQGKEIDINKVKKKTNVTKGDVKSGEKEESKFFDSISIAGRSRSTTNK